MDAPCRCRVTPQARSAMHVRGGTIPRAVLRRSLLWASLAAFIWLAPVAVQAATALPDLTVCLRGLSVLSSGEISLTLDVSNTGRAESPATRVEVTVGEPPLLRRHAAIPALQSGEAAQASLTMQLQPDIQLLGSHLPVTMTVDPAGAVEEENESDNIWVARLPNLSQPDIFPPPEQDRAMMRLTSDTYEDRLFDAALTSFPTELVLHVPVIFEMRITSGLLDEAAAELSAGQADSHANVEIVTHIEADLSPGSGLDVVSHTPGPQTATSQHPAQWAFTITASPAERHIACLTIVARLETEGGSEETLVFVRSLPDIVVRVRFGIAVRRFFGANWQWIVGTVVLGSGLAGFLVRRFRKLLRRPRPPQAPAEDTKPSRNDSPP